MRTAGIIYKGDITNNRYALPDHRVSRNKGAFRYDPGTVVGYFFFQPLQKLTKVAAAHMYTGRP